MYYNTTPDGWTPPVQALAEVLTALDQMQPRPDEDGMAYGVGADIPDAEAGYLRAAVNARDVLTILGEFCEVCGLEARLPRLLLWRGDVAEAELRRRGDPGTESFRLPTPRHVGRRPHPRSARAPAIPHRIGGRL